jgi:hypothetical protein
MFPDRYVIEGSIDHRIMTTTPEQRLARAEELIELGRQNLPLLEGRTEPRLRALENTSAPPRAGSRCR